MAGIVTLEAIMAEIEIMALDPSVTSVTCWVIFLQVQQGRRHLLQVQQEHSNCP